MNNVVHICLVVGSIYQCLPSLGATKNGWKPLVIEARNIAEALRKYKRRGRK